MQNTHIANKNLKLRSWAETWNRCCCSTGGWICLTDSTSDVQL